MIFIYLFLYRSLSGLQNGLGYAKKDKQRFTVSSVLSFGTLFIMFLCLHSFIATFLCILSLIAIWLQDNSFSKRIKELKPNIHLYELLLTSGVTLALTVANYNLIDILCHVYPAMIFHKGFVNLGSGLKFFDYRTNDPTGRTYDINIFGITINIPREPKEVRYTLATASPIIIIISYYNDWFISLEMILNKILSWL